MSLLTLGVLACGPSEGGGAGGSQAGGGETGAGGDGGEIGVGGSGGEIGAGGDGGVGGANTAGVGGTNTAGVGGVGGGAGAGGSAGGTSGGAGGDAGADAGNPPGDAAVGPTLRTGAAQVDRLIGAALSAPHLSEPGYAATAAAEFNFATPENEMKWDATEPERNTFTFARADAIVAFAAQHGMKVKGHTLVWHSQLPSWVSTIQEVTDMRTAMVNHITQVALHFRGKVVAWDVVNEALTDGGQLRASPFAQWIGARFIDDAFIAANAADPGARLYYNDYGAEGRNAKSDAVYNLVQGMLARGVPIHGVGLQMHTGPADVPSAADVASNMQRLAALGLEVAITEMDVQICTGDLDTQRRRFHDIVAGCVAQPSCKSVTVWGVADKYSWRNGQTCATPRPLLFDDNYVKKPAHAGVLNALLGL